MLAGKAILMSSRLIVVMGLAVLFGCAKPPAPPAVEQPPAPEQSAGPNSAPPQRAETPKLPSPKFEEVQQAVSRIFKDVVVIDAARNPSFMAGDFNGDLSEDIAVILKPAEGKLSELNQEFPNWIAREPLEEMRPTSRMWAAKPRPNPASGQTIRFEQRDTLLAIVHGQGPMGWRDNEATQTHLLKNAVGNNIRILPSKEAARVYKGVKPFPTIYGDLIRQTLIGQSGFLHFAGGYYEWYDPKNYKVEPVVRSPHSRMSGAR